MRDKNKMIVGIVFLIGAIYFVYSMLTKDLKSFYITGTIVFTILGLGFIKNSRY